MVFDHRLHGHREEGRGNTFARNIGDDKCNMRAVDFKEIVKISADLLGGVHGRIEVYIGVVDKSFLYGRKRTCLNVCGKVQVGFNGHYFLTILDESVRIYVCCKEGERDGG